MNQDDYYRILSVGKNASWEEIKKAFLKVALVTHPDKGGEAEDFKKANEAYQYFRMKFERGGTGYNSSSYAKSKEETEKDEENKRKNIIFEKLIHSLGHIIGRINFFSITASMAGLVGLFLSVILLIDEKNDNFTFDIGLIFASSFLILSAIYIYRVKSGILKNIGNLDYIKKYLARLSVVTILIAIVVSPILLYGLRFMGILAVIFFFSIIWNTIKSYYLISTYLNPKRRINIKIQKSA